MSPVAFTAPSAFLSSFRGTSFAATCSRPPVRSSAPRAELADLIPGIPPGEDARSFAPAELVIPRPAEDYSKRGFATKLPVTWSGEIGTIGFADIPRAEEEETATKKTEVPKDPVADEAFAQYAAMMKEERETALSALQSKTEVAGRPTCGPSEGRAVISNFNMQSVFGVKCVGYWEKWAADEK